MRLDIDVLSETSEIVIRDKNGEFEVGDPPTPSMEDGSDEGAVDEERENKRMHKDIKETSHWKKLILIQERDASLLR